ncbi:DUF167 domain-containing protein [Lacisediminimonas profundi]|uniref:DUF167 domain-containing protein n=1 Tax=Lacisediminimonas profundi TaxID=2603856 RepID=UPI00124B0D51|nr:DUF167 domain-containing protein [Lacisediminimonas profundi]
MKREMVRLAVQVVPNARKSEVAGEVEGVIRIRLQALPIEGRANEELVRMLAKLLGVSKASVEVVQGQTGRRKLVEIRSNMDLDSVRKMLLGD